MLQVQPLQWHSRGIYLLPLCSSFSYTIVPLMFIISRRLATTHPWMEFCTASPILNNFSKNLETSARIFIQVNLLPLLISHLLESLTILATYSHLSAGKTEKSNDVTRAPSKLSSFFSGTQDKCAACKKTVYPLEKITMEGESYHKTCFRCAHGGCPLTHSSYAALNGILYCKVHFNQLFLEKGNYNHVLAAANHKRSSEEDKTETNEEHESEANPTEEEEEASGVPLEAGEEHDS
ncbi:LIM domain-containing protein PLIM2c isoform X1 [Brassica rapa]|uniref:LIM domain-containing protein PLIM2c isoform X1 n=1 Tax=Brassica campestris TaxID=3711 RepID=UPI00142E79A4|nr:LIM domain-containing protein PLIM2c isoform X1 [Brassica rapa]